MAKQTDRENGSLSRRDLLKAMTVVPSASLLEAAMQASTHGNSAMTSPQRAFVDKDILVPMRDGVKLCVDVHRPMRDGKPVEEKLPVILIRSSYNKEGASNKPGAGRDFIDYFVEHEYVVAIQDVRGRYKSEGSFYHGVHEAQDGYDTIEWVAQQDWCNGKIGMTGVSYLAAVQQAACCMDPPHLSTIFHVQAPADYYQNGFRHAGTFLGLTLPVAFMMLGSTKDYWNDPVLAKDVDGARNRHFEWMEAMPIKRGLTPLSLTDPDNERWFFDMLTHAKYDNFWKKVPLWQPVEYFDKYKDIPSYYVGGWYDVYREEFFYTALSKRKKGPIRLLMGPWLHGGLGNGQTYAGDVDFGPEANGTSQDYFDIQLRWFDQTLKGRDTGIYEEPPIKIFVMGGGDGRKNREGRMNHGGRWRLEADWPLARAKNTEYYFHSDGTLGTSRPQDAEPSSYLFDPTNPVPTIGGSSYFYDSVDNPPFVPMGAYDQRESPDYFGCETRLPLSARQDVLVFRTPPLDNDLELTGPLLTRLWVSSSAVDTDFTAKLIDFYPFTQDYPEGYAMNLSDSILRVQYRESFERPVLMKLGEIYPISIDMPPTSNLFKKGHRIVVHLSSSNYPTYDPNPNTGDPYFMGINRVKAENRIYHDAAHPSHIILPVVSRSENGG